MAGRRPAKPKRSGPPGGDRRENGARAGQAYDGIQRERLDRLQRARMLSAMFDVVAQRGAGSVTVGHVVERSGVSRRTFYEQFSDREDCLLAAFEQALVHVSERVIPAYRSAVSWHERIRAGLIALLTFCDEEPHAARLLIAESSSGGPRMLARRREVIVKLTNIIEEGAAAGKTRPGPLTGEGVVGGVLAVIQARLVEEGRSPLIELTNPLMSMIVFPYMGTGAARRQLERPVESAPATAPRESNTLLSDPFRETGMRLTYRTVRVLLAIAEHPGGSNRLIGNTAGIDDQGQISKLLGRLQRLGLASNTGAGAGKGAPNAWTLTEQGRRIAEGMRVHTEDLQ